MSEFSPILPDQEPPSDDRAEIRCPTCGHDLDLAPPLGLDTLSKLGRTGVSAEMGGNTASAGSKQAVKKLPKQRVSGKRRIPTSTADIRAYQQKKWEGRIDKLLSESR